MKEHSKTGKITRADCGTIGHAARNALRTGNVARLNEDGSGKGETAPKVPVDAFGANLEDLAGKLGL